MLIEDKRNPDISAHIHGLISMEMAAGYQRSNSRMSKPA